MVFVGVYAAFWLNSYQQHQQDAKRRDQILASLEEQLKEGIDSTKAEGAKQDKTVSEFRRALDAGEMPALHPFAFTSDYSASDMATLLQSGGIALLDVKTLTSLRELESVIRGGLSRMAHYERLSDELIAPLQSGGIALLDVKTLTSLRELESVIRGGLIIRHRAEAITRFAVSSLPQARPCPSCVCIIGRSGNRRKMHRA